MEYLQIGRAAAFVSFSLEHDLQVTIHRRTAHQLLMRAIAKDGDESVISWSAEAFDKMSTFLSQNDVQVHYATAAHTVGVYAIVRLLGELRRAIRDCAPDLPFLFGVGSYSPTDRGQRPVIGGVTPLRRPDFHDASEGNVRSDPAGDIPSGSDPAGDILTDDPPGGKDK